MINRRTTVAVAIATGIALELSIHALTGRREAWDSELYWILGLPVAALVSALVGYLARRREWLWTFAVVPAQVVTMMLRSGEIGGLWPLTVALSAILSAPFVLASFIGSRFRRQT